MFHQLVSTASNQYQLSRLQHTETWRSMPVEFNPRDNSWGNVSERHQVFKHEKRSALDPVDLLCRKSYQDLCLLQDRFKLFRVYISMLYFI